MKLDRGGPSIVEEAVRDAEEAALTPIVRKEPIRFDKVVSTGSTLLDLAISGGRTMAGGIPGGILVEIFGPEASGKTAMLMEIIASTDLHGGDYYTDDPEARIDQEYAEIYGAHISENNYYQSDTVVQVFKRFRGWKPSPNKKGAICTATVDSLAALSTDLELDKEEGDKMGMRRAKEFSQELRKSCRQLMQRNWLLVCSNQVRESDHGETTPGGRAVRFYSSLRIRIARIQKNWAILRESTYGSKDISKVIGIHSVCSVVKSTVDDPYRYADVYIMFNHGVDDIRANLQYMKEMSGEKMYDACGKKYQSMEGAIRWIEKESLEAELRERVIETWHKVEQKLRVERKPKMRF